MTKGKRKVEREARVEWEKRKTIKKRKKGEMRVNDKREDKK